MSEPSEQLGRPAGPENGSANPEPVSTSAPTNDAPPTDHVANSAPSAASLLGLPDQLPETWCPNCKADVLPKGKGFCPRCGRMLKGSFLSRRHPVNKLRRDQLLEKLIADYKPRTTLLESSCEMLAGILEQLEVLKPGSAEHQRLVLLSQTLGDTLEASRPRKAAPDPLEGLSDEQVREKLSAAIASATRLLDADRPPPESTVEIQADEAREAESRPLAPTPSEGIAPAVEPWPDVTCGYGCGTLARCAEIKATRPDDWRALHNRDPAEQARRDAEATAVMLKQIGKPSPYS